jgi:acyl-CoA thioesterase
VSVAESRSHWRAMEAVYGESPIHRALGLELRVEGDGEVVIAYDGSLEATNRRGNPAGGALAEMIDSAVVQAARTLLEDGDAATTLELKVNYVRSAPEGERLTTRGTIDHIGRSTAVGHGRVMDEQGRLVALGLVTVSLRRKASGAHT